MSGIEMSEISRSMSSWPRMPSACRALVATNTIGAVHLQQRLHDQHRVLDVVHQQDAQAGHVDLGLARGAVQHVAILFDERQPDREAGALADAFRTGFDAPAMQVDQFAHQRQADAETALGAGGDRIRLAEHVEHLRQAAWRDALAAVRHVEAHRAVFGAEPTWMLPPWGVNLMALLSRFMTICSKRTASAITTSGRPGRGFDQQAAAGRVGAGHVDDGADHLVRHGPAPPTAPVCRCARATGRAGPR
jgi:hypothetical protein